MRVLLAHSFYTQANPSGENRVVEDDLALLRDAPGVEVGTHFRHTDDLTRASTLVSAASMVAGLGLNADLERSLDEHRPDVVHVHHMTPQITPRLTDLCRRRGIRTVRTVHNFRATCLRGTHFRDGHECFLCDRSHTASGVRLGCYRDSKPQSAVVAINKHRFPGTYTDVDRLIALTGAGARYLTDSVGVDPQRVAIRPNYVPPAPARPAREERDGYLFLGRLDGEKGILPLLAAWPSNGPRLTVAGDGPWRDQVVAAVAGLGNVDYVGPLAADAAREAVGRARALVVPSLWAEGYPRVIAEAFAAGTPVCATAGPALQEVVGDAGWLVEEWTAAALSAILPTMETAPVWDAASAAACATYDATLSADAARDALVRVYEDVLA